MQTQISIGIRFLTCAFFPCLFNQRSVQYYDLSNCEETIVDMKLNFVSLESTKNTALLLKIQIKLRQK